MSHHSSEELFKMPDDFRQKMEIEAQRQNLGATGRSPDGRIHQSDEGEIAFGVASDPNKRLVLINFGKPVTWIAMKPEDARNLAESLIEHSFRSQGVTL